MYAEQSVRYPIGTYKASLTCQGGSVECYMTSLSTGRQFKTCSLWEMVENMEIELSQIKNSGFTHQYRSWGPAAEPQNQTNAIIHHNAISTSVEDTSAAPNAATFIVRILYRQNVTWQGTVQWIEGTQTRHYRSLNELLKLMREAAELTMQQE